MFKGAPIQTHHKLSQRLWSERTYGLLELLYLLQLLAVSALLQFIFRVLRFALLQL